MSLLPCKQLALRIGQTSVYCCRFLSYLPEDGCLMTVPGKKMRQEAKGQVPAAGCHQKQPRTGMGIVSLY